MCLYILLRKNHCILMLLRDADIQEAEFTEVNEE